MPNQERIHFSYDSRVSMLYDLNISIWDCCSIAHAIDNMSFDNLENLSRVIIRISNGYFRESTLKNAVRKSIPNG